MLLGIRKFQFSPTSHAMTPRGLDPIDAEELLIHDSARAMTAYSLHPSTGEDISGIPGSWFMSHADF